MGARQQRQLRCRRREDLAQLGITAIDLNPVLATTLNNGNLIYGTDTATLHGHAAALAQLGLSYNATLLHPASMTLN